MNARLAGEQVGPIEKGMATVGLTKGQWSLSDLVLHVLEATGPADLTVSTWTAAGADLDHTFRLLESDEVRSARWLVDGSFKTRQPGYCAKLVELFGVEAVRVIENHAKFVMIRNEAWDVVVMTSMNLNKNSRLEFFSVHEDQELADWLQSVIDEAFAEAPNLELPRVASRDLLHGLGGVLKPSLRAGISYD